MEYSNFRLISIAKDLIYIYSTLKNQEYFKSYKLHQKFDEHVRNLRICFRQYERIKKNDMDSVKKISYDLSLKIMAFYRELWQFVEHKSSYSDYLAMQIFDSILQTV